MIALKTFAAALTVAMAIPASADTLEGRWKLVAAEDLRADGSVGRYPWGQRPVGSIVVQRGWCYIQIMSGDVPVFTADTPPGEAMKSALSTSYLAYAGPCTFNDAEGLVVLKVEAASRADYPGTEQRRFYRFDRGRLLFGPAPDSIAFAGERLTRRLTLERQ